MACLCFLLACLVYAFQCWLVQLPLVCSCFLLAGPDHVFRPFPSFQALACFYSLSVFQVPALRCFPVLRFFSSFYRIVCRPSLYLFCFDFCCQKQIREMYSALSPLYSLQPTCLQVKATEQDVRPFHSVCPFHMRRYSHYGKDISFCRLHWLWIT